jgi:hypothetical protein
MSEQQNFGFGKFVPGFDFLQSLSKGATQPSVSSWVAPTLNVEELDKRIGELKAVSFWLEQNSRALAATIQALELQKMTLATLKGMNFNMGELAQAMKLKPGAGAAQASSSTEPAGRTGSIAGAATPVPRPARRPRASSIRCSGGVRSRSSSRRSRLAPCAKRRRIRPWLRRVKWPVASQRRRPRPPMTSPSVPGGASR